MRSSMQQELVAAATLAWVWQTNVNDLTRQLERLLCSPYRAIEWRTDKVIDFRDLNVPQIAERLVRWDSRHPDTVFQDGFLPRAVDCTDAAMSLKQYVSTNHPSIFVGTARYYTRGNRLRFKLFEVLSWLGGHISSFTSHSFSCAAHLKRSPLSPREQVHLLEASQPSQPLRV